MGGEMNLERTKGSFSISLRCCCRSSSDTRKKKRRLLLVRNSWRRLLSVRSGMSNSSFSVENQGAREVLTCPSRPVHKLALVHR